MEAITRYLAADLNNYGAFYIRIITLFQRMGGTIKNCTGKGDDPFGSIYRVSRLMEHMTEPANTRHTASSRQWLILAHCFNMDGRAASQTITDRIPFIMADGVTPVVLSAPTGDRDDRFPHYQIISPAPSGILFEMRHIIRAHTTRRWVEKLLKALLTIVLAPFLLVEKIFVQFDSQWSWFIAAVPQARRLVRQYRPEIIYSTAGPPSTHVAGYLLKRWTGLPWLAEVHDPLIHDNERPRWHHYWYRRWLEGKIFKHADAIVYFTHRALDHASHRQGARHGTIVLRPGAEAPVLEDIVYEKGDRLHIGHFGSLAEDRNLCAVMKALADYGAAHPEWRDRLRLDVFGTDLDGASKGCMQSLGVSDMVRQHGRLEYDPETGKSGRRRVLERMRQCDILLLVHGTDTASAEYIPSKLYEYLHAGRPILGVAGVDTELGDILIEEHHYMTVTDDEDTLRNTLEEMVSRWQTGTLGEQMGPSPYTVQVTVAQLLDIVSALTDQAGHIESGDRSPRE